MSKSKIINSIRGSLRRRQPLDPVFQQGLRDQLGQHRIHVQPQFSGDNTERFCQRHIDLKGTLAKISRGEQLADRLENYLAENELPRNLIMGKSPLFDSVMEDERFQTETRSAGDGDLVCVSNAYAAVAETGTLVLVSGFDSPMTHNYLPDHHIVILNANRIVKWQEQIWQMLRRENQFPPRGICFISGPSKTADVELTIEYGAHGPRCLHVVLLDPESETTSNAR